MTATLTVLRPERRPVVLVSTNQAHEDELKSARLPVARFSSTVSALDYLKRMAGTCAIVLLDADLVSAKTIPGFIKALHRHEEGQDLSPTPVMLIWLGANFDALRLAEETPIPWHYSIPQTGPRLLGVTVSDMLSSAVPLPARLS